jgi:hypothetical protein
MRQACEILPSLSTACMLLSTAPERIGMLMEMEITNGQQ